jgi:3-methylfumaryl-CoA hydratase
MENAVSDPLERMQDWIGRSESADDVAWPTPVVALSAMLDHLPGAVGEGTALPPLWHWLYFLPMHRQSEIGPDGHARRGGFLPPVPLPRRMWAGSQFEFRAPVRVGDTLQRLSTIEDVAAKAGRSGSLVFVKVRHELRCNGAAEPAIVEFHDIVYRQARQPGDAEPPPQSAPADAAWSRDWLPDEVMLFRYSALTFNGHRIHYDRPYATAVEGYPGLVVHGPLIATLLLDLQRRQWPEAEVATFRFKALRPSFDGRPLRVNGRPEGSTVRLWAQDHEGWLTMDASATLR